MVSLKSFLTFFSESTTFAALKHNDLTKRGGARITVFTDKVKNGDAFLTTHGNVIIDKASFKKATGLKKLLIEQTVNNNKK